MAEEKKHIGIYGVLLKDAALLLVKKTRGPYKGKYDLPGGAPLHGEAINTTLIREVLEETGVVVEEFSAYQNYSCLVNYLDDKKKEISLHHLGLLYLVTEYNAGAFQGDIHFEDVDGCRWIPLDEIKEVDVSPFTWKVVQNILS